MKKSTTILFGLSLCALISMFATSPTQASIERFTWLPPYLHKGYHSHYGSDVVIYRDGASVDLIVPVYNDEWWWLQNGLNVSKVIVSFDWGENKTLNLSPIEQVALYETKTFTVSFTADADDAVSSDWAHEYTIYVEHANATTGPTELVGTWTSYWNSFWPNYLFVVYPTDQADATDLSDEYDSYASAFPTWMFTNTNASQLAGQASIKASLGDTYYARGDFASAEEEYQTALERYSQALVAEREWQTKVEEADLSISLTEADANLATANAMLRQADAAVTQALSWIVFGIGFVFMGVATIVYAYRKPVAG
jgi:hypothetical protein